MLILTWVSPVFDTIFSTVCKFFWSSINISILEIGLLIKFFKEDIFLTLILLNLLSSSEIFLEIVNIKELPSINISLFKSKTSEKINNSKTEVKSVNLIIA